MICILTVYRLRSDCEVTEDAHVPGLVLILAGALPLAVPACAADCVAQVKDSDLIRPGTLVMSTNSTLPPLQFVNGAGELVGMRIDLGREVAKRLCLAPDFIRIDFSAMVPGLQAGRWDAIDMGIFFTPERAKIMQMIPYESQAISISVPAGSADTVKAPADLDGKTVGVEIGGFEENKTKALDADRGVPLRGPDARLPSKGCCAPRHRRPSHPEAADASRDGALPGAILRPGARGAPRRSWGGRTDRLRPQMPLRPVPLAALAVERPEWGGHRRSLLPS